MAERERNVESIGKGRFFTVRLVRNTPYGKRIWKRMRATIEEPLWDLDAGIARDYVDTHSRYVAILKRDGIRTVPAVVRARVRGKQFIVDAFQRQVPKDKFLDAYLRNAPREEALRVFTEVSRIAAKIARRNSFNDTEIFLDMNLKNWALDHKGRPALVDHYPSAIRFITRKGWREYSPDFHVLFLEQRERNKGSSRDPISAFNELFHPVLPLAWVYESATEIRPELKREFRETVKRVLPRYFGRKTDRDWILERMEKHLSKKA